MPWTNVAWSQPLDPDPAVLSFEQSFQEGVKLYQNKDFEKARSSFEASLVKDPHNISVLTNLGMVFFEIGKKGLALAYLRRALEIDADFRPAQTAYNYVWSRLEVKELPHRLETYESLRDYLLKPVSLSSYLWLGSLFFLLSGWLLIRFFGKRKRAFEEELPLPPFPTVGFMIMIIFITFFSLTLLKVYDLTLTRATITAEKVPMHTAPNENEASLFELSQGLEVILRKSEADWVQVTYPGGPTGWVKKTELMVTTDGSI
ncbi:MAG: SH3 domain-containing protein [Bdellovibrionota bacterium]